MIDPNDDIVPTLRMFDGLMMGQAADAIEKLRVELKAALQTKMYLESVNSVQYKELAVLRDAPPASRFSRNEAREEGYREGLAAMREMAASVIDECNRTGPYDAIGAAGKIRALPSGDEGKPA